ncbi:hypothetical protein [Chryseobacterium salviniae]|uniref:MORN repeat variant n=1 Tax=Chryseobacterium salviniae TaxID=3101750 RepID=A0ABU6HUQ0_9FLAO|nr:hypothetical protein [Chryseobacterium sp. T9W2-O]MEC3876789.1 hypothetical protein [Chryseobacterium sp. T9W2-O]
MQKKYIILLLILSLVSCKTKINQYIKDENNVNKRNGRWKEEYSSDEGILTAFGKYKKGEKVGIWKTYFNGKLNEKNKIKNTITKTKKYFPNGKLMEIGQSKINVSKNERHWFYFGDWKYYDQKGNLRYIKKYTDGKKMDSVSFIK